MQRLPMTARVRLPAEGNVPTGHGPVGTFAAGPGGRLPGGCCLGSPGSLPGGGGY